jgi:hypothetical protein
MFNFGSLENEDKKESSIKITGRNEKDLYQRYTIFFDHTNKKVQIIELIAEVVLPKKTTDKITFKVKSENKLEACFSEVDVHLQMILAWWREFIQRGAIEALENSDKEELWYLYDLLADWKEAFSSKILTKNIIGIEKLFYQNAAQLIHNQLDWVKNRVELSKLPKNNNDKEGPFSYSWLKTTEISLASFHNVINDVLILNCTYEEFAPLFSKKPLIDIKPIRWKTDLSTEIVFFYNELQKFGFIEAEKTKNKWVRLSSCFVKSNGQPFINLSKVKISDGKVENRKRITTILATLSCL